MAITQLGAALHQIQNLFGEGTLGGLTDAQLVERFVGRRDESAFAVLVERHGPMVLGTCHAVLKDRHDAEDAFQAVFLVLVKKADSIRGLDALGGWLHRVAYRIALHANADAARRRVLEREAGEMAATILDPDRLGDDLCPLLHAELDRLPERFRLPLVLCDLEGLSREQAATQLRWTLGTLRGRLAKARTLLRSRLTRRGVTLPAGVLSAMLAREAVAEVPADLVLATTRAALSVTAGGAVSTTAVLLADRVLKASTLARWKLTGTAMLMVAASATALAIAGLVNAGSGNDEKPEPAEAPKMMPAPVTAPTKDAKARQAGDHSGEWVTVRGRVLDPKGRPVDGATLRVDEYMFRTSPDPTEIPPKAKSQVDGRFTLDVPKEVLDQFSRGERRRPIRVVATAPGFGFGWAEPGPRSDALKDMTIRLVEDDRPLEGRIVDLEGRPVAGAVIKTETVFVPTSGDLSSWIGELKTIRGKGPYDGNDEMPFYEVTRTTGADGRFRIEGVGRERIVQFTVSGPTVEVTRGFAMTKETPAVAAPNPHITAPDTIRYHGSRFDYASAPCKPVDGVVRDQDTGAPLAGIQVNGMAFDPHSSAYYHEVVSITDDQGRYRLTGMARSDRYHLFVSPGKGQPYPSANFVERADSPGLEPATINLKLKRGVLIRGRLTDKATGKPVRGMVASFVLRENPYAKDYAGIANGYDPIGYTDAEGRFEVSALPGPGFIAARAESPSYLSGVGAEAIPGWNPFNMLSTVRSFVDRDFYHVFAPTNPEIGSESTTCDLRVEPGRTLSLTVVDPEGKPLSGAAVKGLYSDRERLSLPQESATLELTGIDPRRPRRVYAFHQGRKLGGSLFLKGVEDSALKLPLEPLGVISGRLVDDEGAPRKGLQLVGFRNAKLDPTHGDLMNDEPVGPDGRFRIEVVPGLTYEATALSEDRKTLGQAFEGVTTGPGETKDLGDVKLTQPAK